MQKCRLKNALATDFTSLIFFVESNRWLQIRGFFVTILNVLLFLPWGIYLSFFYDKKRTVGSALVLSSLVEVTQLFANFGVFSVEDIILNTLGAFLGIWLYQKYVCRISHPTIQKINKWTIRIGGGFSVLAYVNVIVAIIFRFS